MNFMLVMILHPDVQQKAQKLVDSVVGPKRLPTFHDRPSLPYIDAILRECLRWHPVFPLGVSHTSAQRNWIIDLLQRSCMLLSKATFTKVITYPQVCEVLLILESTFIRSTGATVTPNVWYEDRLFCGL